MATPSDVLDVIIVGAGLTGILTGYHLTYSNARPTMKILEAKRRVGGRVRNVPSYRKDFGFDLDIGASDLFYADKCQLKDYFADADRDGRLDFRNNAFATNPRPVKKDDGFLSYRDCDPFYNGECLNSITDFTLSRRFEASSFENETLANFLETYFVKTVEDNIVKDSPISRINVLSETQAIDEARVLASTLSGEIYRAKHLILAVPVTQLVSLAPDPIRISPPLPDRYRNSIETTAAAVNKGTRIFVEFSTKFYEDFTQVDGTLYFDAARFKNTDKNIVSIQGSSCKNPSEAVCNKKGNPRSKKGLLNKLLKDLDKAYGNNVATNSYIENGNVTHFENWSKQRYIEMTTVGNVSDVEVYEEPVGERLWFAGDYTVPQTGNEAYQSAVATAKRVSIALEEGLESC